MVGKKSGADDNSRIAEQYHELEGLPLRPPAGDEDLLVGLAQIGNGYAAHELRVQLSSPDRVNDGTAGRAKSDIPLSGLNFQCN